MIFDSQYILFFLFLCSLFFIAYIHFLYPLVLLFISIFSRTGKEKSKNSIAVDKLPSVTLLIAAYNEEVIIEEKISNSLKLNYPENLLQIIIFSDGSTDKTDSIVQKFRNIRVELVRVEGRLGKTACQNIAARKATGQIIIYSDATSIYQKNAILHLVECFNSHDVGCVIGRVGSEIELHRENFAQEETFYLKFSQWVKNLEGCASMPVGASGAIFAIRKDLLVELPANANDDLLRPLSVIQQGYTVVYQSKAIAWERFSDSYANIFEKKIRIGKRAIYSLFYARSLLNPFRYSLFSLQFLTKTLLRRLLFPHYVFLLFSSILLTILTKNIIYSVFVVTLLLALLFAAVGYIVIRKDSFNRTFFLKLCMFCYYYLVVITGAFFGIVLGLTGKEIHDWKPQR